VGHLAEEDRARFPECRKHSGQTAGKVALAGFEKFFEEVSYLPPEEQPEKVEILAEKYGVNFVPRLSTRPSPNDGTNEDKIDNRRKLSQPVSQSISKTSSMGVA
jgi:hypothetical protein